MGYGSPFAPFIRQAHESSPKRLGAVQTPLRLAVAAGAWIVFPNSDAIKDSACTLLTWGPSRLFTAICLTSSAYLGMIFFIHSSHLIGIYTVYVQTGDDGDGEFISSQGGVVKVT